MRFARLNSDRVNRASETVDGIAGKSINVAKVLAALGEQPFAVGFAGGDRGRELLDALSARRIEHQFHQVEPRTRQCITLLDQSTNAVTELVEESRPVSPHDYEALWAIVTQRLDGCRAVVMSGSLTPGAPADFYQHITEQAGKQGRLTVVDAQGAPLANALKARPGLVKPNREELAATVARPVETEADVIEGIREVVQRGAQRVVVTAGRNATLASDGGRLWRIEAPVIPALNPIGSGDAFTAGLVWRLLQGQDLGEACRWATAAGAANATGLMPGELERDQVERLVKQVTVSDL